MSTTRGLLAATVVAFVLAACGGSSSTTASSSSATTTTSTTVEASTAAPSTSSSTSSTSAASTATPPLALHSGSQDVSFTVDGVERTAVVVVPADTTKPAPLVFVFHGHGGAGHYIQRKLQVEDAWPGAVVVYPDGLVGHKGITDPDGTKPGWQTVPGEAGDRDLHFFDTMLDAVRASTPVDANRIFTMGHSNGSQMASLVLNQRPAEIAATANLSSTPNALLATDPVRSMFFAMGTGDPIVPIAHQQAAIAPAERLLGLDPANATTAGDVTTVKAAPPSGIELQYKVYDGGHEPPDGITAEVVAFLQRHTLSGG